MGRNVMCFILSAALLACSDGNAPPATTVTPSASPIATPTSPIFAASASAAETGWDDLRRPWATPEVTPGTACPIGRTEQRTSTLGAGAGGGPFFVTMGSTGGAAILPYTLGNAYNGDWGGQKTLWYADPAYRGPALIRGRRLDGPGELRFDYFDASQMASELRLDTRASSTPGEWPSWIGATRIRLDSPGCYAFQVDGLTFTEIIVFSAVLTP